MATTYKAEQVKFALARLRAAVERKADELDLKQLSCNARLAGATVKQISRAWPK